MMGCEFETYLRDVLMRIGVFKSFGTKFFKKCRRIDAINDDVALKEECQRYLGALLLHAYLNVTYYRDILRQYSIKDIKEASIFHEIPLLTKSIIRKRWNELISSDIQSRKWYYNTSGGSTGEPVKFIQDNLYDMWGTIAYLYYYKKFLEINEPVVKKVLLWGSERDILRGSTEIKAYIKWLLFSNTIFVNTFRMTKDDMYRCLKIINSFKPTIIRGYASSLYEIARFAEEKGINLWRPKAIISTAEPITLHMRETISRVFDARVYNYYGSREVNGIAGECNYGLLHIFSFHNFVEVVDPNTKKPANEGEEGLVVVTNLHNYSMPLIRYEIGDVATLGPIKCKCGNPNPTLKRVVGRVVDNFVTRNGTIVYGEYFTHLFYFKDWIKSFRVVQEDYDRIRILVVLTSERMSRKDMEDLESKIRLVMGRDCKIVWEFVDEIPKTREGKHLYTISYVWSR